MPTSPIRSVIQRLRQAALVGNDTEPTDAQLLQSFVNHRDETAFAALVRRHGPMVLGVCRRIVGNFHDADDAFQATFLVLVRKAASLRKRELLGNWLYGVAYRTALKAKAATARRHAKEKKVKGMPIHQACAEAGWHELQQVLDRELSRLPDHYRVPIVHCELQGKTRKEAARQLGIPEGTLSSRLAMARRMLAKRLSRHGLAFSGGALAAMMSANGASACVANALLVSTVQTAMLFATGRAAATVQAVALAEGVVKAMLLAKLRIVFTGLLIAAVVFSGTATLLHKPIVAEASPMQTATKKSVERQEEWKPPPLPPDIPRWGPVGRPLYLVIANPVVQAELNLDIGQRKAVAAMIAGILEPLRKWRQLESDELAGRHAFAKKVAKKGLPRILNQRQQERLSEIDLQQRIPMIAGDKEVAAKLKLTESQQRALHGLAFELRVMRAASRFLNVNDVYKNQYPKYKDEMQAERQQIIQDTVKSQAEYREQIEAVLTNEQKTQLRAMLGKKFDFAAYLDAIE